MKKISLIILLINILPSAVKSTDNPNFKMQITATLRKHIRQATVHLKAWFIDPETMMNPNLQYAQAIKNLTTGRGIGIIDTIQLMEVVQGLMTMENAAGMDKKVVADVRNWFARYLVWL